ncbi:3-oxoacyl-(acyl-carrier-protein) reductase [Thiorhodococcus drewsii AZ1]|uniref:3-oxoacyl-(Acyl-carrier-protein) reductase n=1 Tax=Thiorhodococcus drewsii AZ1 TaxID=765913 RepID=G2E6Q6_9GAMM|nr:SDR family oxidoreductase [Thiorhodococcus drewsii]EGV28203.1 3-oxoacyl-(acyl-carrier-protein) reductase [Thiorhodococcus drewsii AZ1]
MTETDRTPVGIVTGGAQGIGRALTQHFLEAGWRILVLDRDAEAIADLEQDLQHPALLACTSDVGEEAAVTAAFAALTEWQSRDGQSAGIDLLVNNAGIADPHSGPLESLTLADWRRWQDSHLTGAFLCTRAAIPGLQIRHGAIVNIASTRALQSEPNCEAYAAAKGGLLSLTHALAISLGPEILVNAVSPGWIETGPWQKSSTRHTPTHRPIDHSQHAVGRIGEPADIVAAVAFLASPQAGFITGQNLVVDGGMTRTMIYAG